MTPTHRVVTLMIKGLTRVLCRVDDAQLARVPDRGPLILVAKAYRWEKLWTRWLLDMCGAIPSHKGRENPLQAGRGV